MQSILLIDLNEEDAGYRNLVQTVIQLLEGQGIHYSKLSVNHVLESPIALRFAIEKFRTTIDKRERKPDGYIVLGYISRHETFESIVYEEVLRSLQDMGCYYGLALSHYTAFQSKSLEINIEAVSNQVVLSCIKLIQLKKQLGLQPNHISTP